MDILYMVKGEGPLVSMLVEKRYRVGEVALNYAEGPETGPPIVLTHGLTDRW